MGFTRRSFHKGAASALLLPAFSRAADRPLVTTGCSSGDASADGAVIWSRTTQPARLWVEVSSDDSFRSPLRFAGGNALPETDFNARAVISGLEAGRDWFYRVQFESLEGVGLMGDTVSGRFRTAPRTADDSIRFCWSGDTVGQGYGIDPSRGGMQTYAAMLQHSPQFLVHSGDQIYADGPVPATLALDDGSVWRNITTAGKSKVAESVQEFRENYYYNHLDEHYSRFHRAVPVYYQWDDHEVANNWFPGKALGAPFKENRASLLAARARHAMFECNPLRRSPLDPERLFRVVHYGPLLDLFFLDLRSYRGVNSVNRQTSSSAETAFLGATQLQWLKQELQKSTATWKIICSDMPIGLCVTDFGTDIAENWANADNGAPLGRELELQDLLGFIHRSNISNVHFITADVHFCASYHYSPDRAAFKDFTPFWEFVSGPLHAGTFAPSALDMTFGPAEHFCGVPHNLPANRPPSANFQFFGVVTIDKDSHELTVAHYNRLNEKLWEITLSV